MSFICKGCGRHRAGASGVVCADCRNTQAGDAGELLEHFEGCRVSGEFIEALDEILGKAQNGPPNGEADGSIDADRWARLSELSRAATAFNAAIDRVSERS